MQKDKFISNDYCRNVSLKLVKRHLHKNNLTTVSLKDSENSMTKSPFSTEQLSSKRFTLIDMRHKKKEC